MVLHGMNVLRADWRVVYQTSLSRNLIFPSGNSICGEAPLSMAFPSTEPEMRIALTD